MYVPGRSVCAAAAALIAVALLAACGGSHSSSAPALPVVTQAVLRAQAAGTDIIAINAGGGGVGSFSADRDYNAAPTWTSSVTKTIDTSGVSNPAPQAVYQSARQGNPVTYTIAGLTTGASYSVRLDFAELFWSARGQRVFNIAINGRTVLSAFDIIAAAGAADKAIDQTFTTTAMSGGTIVISLTPITDHPAINGIEIASADGSTPPPPPQFNDYVSYDYDGARDSFDPNSTAISPATFSKLHLAWQSRVGGGDYSTQTQPILATEIPGHAGVLFVGGGSGRVYGYDALTGAELWQTSTGQETYSCGSSQTFYFGIGGSAAYDPATKSLYILANSNPSRDAYAAAELYRLDAATGHVIGKVDVTPTAAGPSELNFGHTSVTLRAGLAYVGTGSTCDISSWRGRIVAVNVPAMTVANTFFTVWDPANARGQGSQPWGGGGVWGWGGVALDPGGNVLSGVGNSDNGISNGRITAPFVKAPHEYSGYGNSLLKLTPTLGVLADNHPIPLDVYSRTADDMDVQGTPLVLTPNGAGCAPMVAVQGKSGELSFYTETNISGGVSAQYQLSPPSSQDGYLGDPAYSPATGLVYAPVASSQSPTLFAPGLIAVNPGCGQPGVTWRASFGVDSTSSGTPRSAPAVSAGGVVFAGTVNGSGGELWALNASTGALLNGGSALLHTNGSLRMPATIDGDWVFVMDDSGDLYGLTTDANYPTIAPLFAPVTPDAVNHAPPAHP